MSNSFERSQQEETHGNLLGKIGAVTLASILIAGGATINWAYNDLQRGVEGPVFDIHHAETHALGDAEDSTMAQYDPAQFSTETQVYSVVFNS